MLQLTRSLTHNSSHPKTRYSPISLVVACVVDLFSLSLFLVIMSGSQMTKAMRMRALCLIYTAACNPDFKKDSHIDNYEVECDQCAKRAFTPATEPWVSWTGAVFCSHECVTDGISANDVRREYIQDLELIPLWDKIKLLRQCSYLDPNLVAS